MSNHVFTHPGQPQLQAEVILASSTALSPNIYTIRGRLPRCIWPEVLTHRVFGRNGRSSRAVPVKRMLEEIRTIPFTPWHWGKNQKGMQAFEEQNTPVELDDVLFNAKDQELEWVSQTMSNQDAWLSARDSAVEHAEAFMKAGYHKQIVNRLLEPFMWIDVVMTATDWHNFAWLRQHEDAEPHLQDWARLLSEAIYSCDIQELSDGDWHLPYITYEDRTAVQSIAAVYAEQISILRKISAARCARVSYKLFDGSNPSIEEDLDLYQKLVGNSRIHASPMEHQATPDERKILYYSKIHADMGCLETWKRPELHGNLTGWIQHRKLIPGERWTGDLAE